MRTLLALMLLFCVKAALAFTPIPASQAFQVHATVRDNQTIVMHFAIEPGYYLYKNKFHFVPIKPKDTRFAPPLLPNPIDKYDKVVGHYQVYEGALNFAVPLINNNGQTITFRAHYQGCAASGYCYPPQNKTFTINLSAPAGTAVMPLAATHALAKPQAAPSHTQSQFTNILAGKHLGWVILSFIGFGILISLTPCVLPMIPILSSIIAGQKHLTHRRSFLLALTYVFGMALTYAAAGVVFGYVGSNIQTWLQTPWVITVFAAVFVTMALSMFGLFELQLPQSWRSRLAKTNQAQRGGTYAGAFFMGILSTLILSPCVTPALVGALSFISKTGDAVIGGVALFSLGLGIGIPLLIIGAFGKHLLPKAGHWMEGIKGFIGVLLLAVAISLITRITNGLVAQLLWAAFAFGVAVFFGAFASVETRWACIKKGLGIVIFIYGILLAVGAAQGNYNLLRPIAWQGTTVQQGLQFTRITSLNQFATELQQAQTNHQLIMLDFSADWCIACKEMAATTFQDPQVIAALKNAKKLQIDLSANDDHDQMMMHHFDVVAPPTIVFYQNGKELQTHRIIGEVSAQELLQRLPS